MQGKLILSLGLLGLANCQQQPQQQPAMALERRDLCWVNCGEGWCCVGGQKCIAGPSKDFDTPYGCEDELLGFTTTWGAYRGDLKGWTSDSDDHHKPEPTPAPPVNSRSTTATSHVAIVTSSYVVPPPPPPPAPAPSSSESPSSSSPSIAIISYPVHEPESSSTVIPSSTSSSWVYIQTTYPESSSTPSDISYSTISSYSNSTTSLQEPQTSDAADTTTPPLTTPTNTAPQQAQTSVVPGAAGRVSLGNTVAAAGFLATVMGFILA